ncbi:hypothetical protein H9Y05_08795 [Crocinitomicaceae bacterium CZZ-1]|uniref:Uncharacterized protein n=1 Tax=Taishania pollutisoli TaxID=2766479 RepID=A0A8J6U2A3_9FLAO|nr:hypothetical protein [Taishania pollutisoli]MBC9812565.1 hypothetical protein [Taishania pollutisoli]
MFYRVKKYDKTYKNMFVLDSDLDLTSLKSRTEIEDCAKRGYEPFSNDVTHITSQDVTCKSMGGKKRHSDIIEI